MNKTAILILGLILGFLLGNWWSRREVWTGFYYPDNDKTYEQSGYLVSPPLYSLKECQSWVDTVKKPTDNNYGYLCNRGCRFESAWGEIIRCRTKER